MWSILYYSGGTYVVWNARTRRGGTVVCGMWITDPAENHSGGNVCRNLVLRGRDELVAV